MSDPIDRQTAYAVLSEYYHHKTEIQHKALREALDRVPSATQTNAPNVLNALDCVSRRSVLEAIDEIESEVADGDGFQYEKWKRYFCELPSADIDLSDYSDRLWRSAYEQGKADAESEIIRCKDCKYASLTYDGDCKYCSRWDEEYEESTSLYLDGDFYCGFAERKE